jgi:hypothetical protein
LECRLASIESDDLLYQTTNISNSISDEMEWAEPSELKPSGWIESSGIDESDAGYGHLLNFDNPCGRGSHGKKFQWRNSDIGETEEMSERIVMECVCCRVRNLLDNKINKTRIMLTFLLRLESKFISDRNNDEQVCVNRQQFVVVVGHTHTHTILQKVEQQQQ